MCKPALMAGLIMLAAIAVPACYIADALGRWQLSIESRVESPEAHGCWIAIQLDLSDANVRNVCRH